MLRAPRVHPFSQRFRSSPVFRFSCALRIRWAVTCLALAIGLTVTALNSSCAAPPDARSLHASTERGDLLTETLRVLDERIPDLRFRRSDVRAVRLEFDRAESTAAQREVVRRFLDTIPTSHLALFSTYAKRVFERELAGAASPTLGLSITQIDGEWIIAEVQRGTPAEEAGIVRGDRLLAIDGISPGVSARLDPRHDDAAPPHEPAHILRVRSGEKVEVEVARGGVGVESHLAVALPVVVRSALESDRLGVHLREIEGVEVGVIPFSFIYTRDTTRLFADAIGGPLAGADALVLDLRGRGGNGIALIALLSMLENEIFVDGMPIVATIDGRTRSAKELIARSIRERRIGTLVGEKTPGAVRPSHFVELTEDSWLLCPHGPIGTDPRGLEGVGVEPDLVVVDPFPEGDGADPILDAAVREAARQAVAATSEKRSPRSPRPRRAVGERRPRH